MNTLGTEGGFADTARHMIMPVIVLATSMAGSNIRYSCRNCHKKTDGQRGSHKKKGRPQVASYHLSDGLVRFNGIAHVPVKELLQPDKISLLMAVPAGIYSAIHQYSKGDYAVVTFSFLGSSIPGFFLAIFLASKAASDTLGPFSISRGLPAIHIIA